MGPGNQEDPDPGGWEGRKENNAEVARQKSP